MSASEPLQGSSLCGEGEAAAVLPSCTEEMASFDAAGWHLAGQRQSHCCRAACHTDGKYNSELVWQAAQASACRKSWICSLSTAAPQEAREARLTHCLPAWGRAWREAWVPAGAIGMSDLACCATGPTSPLLPDSVLAARDEPCLLSAAVGPFVSLAPLGVGLPASSLPSAAFPAGAASPKEEAGRCTTKTLAAEDSAAAVTFFSPTRSVGTALGCWMGRCIVPAVAA